jgi:hypothetical protein
MLHFILYLEYVLTLSPSLPISTRPYSGCTAIHSPLSKLVVNGDINYIQLNNIQALEVHSSSFSSVWIVLAARSILFCIEYTLLSPLPILSAPHVSAGKVSGGTRRESLCNTVAKDRRGYQVWRSVPGTKYLS